LVEIEEILYVYLLCKNIIKNIFGDDMMAVMIWTKTARIFFRLAPVLICPCRFTLFRGYRYYPYLTTINFTDGVGA
jgi:hypothetical protein